MTSTTTPAQHDTVALIRPYHSDDLDSLMAAWEQASRLAHQFMEEAFFEQERHNIPNLYLPNTDTWVAEVDGTVVGFIALMGNAIGGLFVDPRLHGHGIGRALVDKAVQLHQDVTVDVLELNQLGRAFYQRYGFTLVEQRQFEFNGVHPLLHLAYTRP